MFTGVLSGAAVGGQVGSMYKHMDRQQDVGHYFCLVDIAAFMDPDQFRQRIDSTIDAIKACRRRPDAQEILVPGERSHRKAEENRRLGIPIGPETLDEFKTLSCEYGVPMRLEPLPASEEMSR
jgi:ureidoglycolate dehydrogenase (NAD+)